VGRVYGAITTAVAQAIGTVAPGAAMQYIKRRAVLSSYSAASRSGPNKSWNPSNKSASEIIKKDHSMLRARARALVRDSSHVSGALRKITNNVVFKGIQPQARIKTQAGELRDTQNERAEQAWREWAKAVNFHEKENLILRHWWQDGELFAHYFFDEDLLRRGVIPLGVELLECDHLDTSRTSITGDSKIKQGIQYSASGRPIGYWLYPEHPGDSTWLSMTGSQYYPATVLSHLFSRERISQNRGISWLASIIMEMRDFSEYQSAERIAARLAAAFGIFVKMPHTDLNAGISPIGGDGSDAMSPDDLPDYLEPGRIQPLPPGWDISSASYERPGQTYEPFTKTTLRGASTGAGMSYEAYSNDYTDASYASARSATLEERRGYQVQQQLLTRMFHAECWSRLWGMNQLSRVESLPAEIPVTWQVPGWPWVDPDKDSKAAERDIKNGLNSRHRVAMERGNDYTEIIQDLQREAEDGFPIGGEGDNDNAPANPDDE